MAKEKSTYQDNYLHNGCFALPVNAQDVGDLNDRVLVGLGKMTLTALALDIDRKNTEGRNLVPLAL